MTTVLTLRDCVRKWWKHFSLPVEAANFCEQAFELLDSFWCFNVDK